MIIFWQIVFWLSIFLILHSYVFFPTILSILAKNKKENIHKYSKDDDLPSVSIIMAVYNEQDVIEQKIRSVFNTNYPQNKIEFIIGSDNSTDDTNNIIKKLQQEYLNLQLVDFKERNGKIKIINLISEQCKNQIIISTDAKVFFLSDTIFHLIEHFKNPEISIVGGILFNEQKSSNGISNQEDLFMSREMIIKYNEGLVWQKVIGVYGALYAIRPEFLVKVPENLLVDDFYITLKVIENKGKVIFNKQAKASENLPVELSEEFKRKVRIATGNFQNLRIFSKILLKPFSSIGFSFISHKVIRWTAPFIFMIALIANLFLFKIILYKVMLFITIGVVIVPIIDFFFKIFKINIGFLRLITHFISMNFALVFGFFRALKGVRNSTWSPSKRNQTVN
ncbi:MAG: glycosyltransferase [Bacteroidales bacterium]|nr:glycosyltransferase [Bacteroidales bacterium]